MTGHPGSRTTSYLQAGDAATAIELPAAVPVIHWYFLSGVEVLTSATTAAIAILGDSISDGRGSTTDGNDRWTDNLAREARRGGPDGADRRSQSGAWREWAAARRRRPECAGPLRPRRAFTAGA